MYQKGDVTMLITDKFTHNVTYTESSLSEIVGIEIYCPEKIFISAIYAPSNNNKVLYANQLQTLL